GSSSNPIDLLGGATAESFAAALPPVLADPAFDAAIVLYVPTVGADEEEVGAAISRAAATAVDKPVLCVFVSAKGAPAGLRGVARTRRLLEAYRVPLVPERLAATPQAAVDAAVELGYPVVLKTAAPGAHKTDEGGVILDLGDEEAVRVAAERLGGPLLVQPFVRGGAELLAGAVQDPVFGPLVA